MTKPIETDDGDAGLARIDRWVDLPCSGEQVWAEIGGFLAIADWHPALASAEEVEIDGRRHRRVVTTYGAPILERLVERGPRVLRVSVVESQLPLEAHQATLTCVDRPGGCRVRWTAEFRSAHPRAAEIIASIHDMGLAALAERHGARSAAAPAGGAAPSGDAALSAAS